MYLHIMGMNRLINTQRRVNLLSRIEIGAVLASVVRLQRAERQAMGIKTEMQISLMMRMRTLLLPMPMNSNL